METLYRQGMSLSNYLVFSVFFSANSNYLFNYKHCDWNYVNDNVKMVKFKCFVAVVNNCSGYFG